MNKAQIIETQKKIGTEPDGFWGPKSVAACQAHLRKLMPSPNPWPSPDQKSLKAFYGAPGDESQHIRINVSGLGLRYDGKAVSEVLCHKKVGPSLLRVLKELAKRSSPVLSKYAGVYNNRNVRGGSSPSLHAYAAAIDLNPETNSNKSHWPLGATMPLEVMEVFAREGWMAAGAFWSRDAMHFQGTK